MDVTGAVKKKGWSSKQFWFWLELR